MPNTKSAKKALRKSKKVYVENRRMKLRIKRWMKKLNTLLEKADKDSVEKTYYFLQKLLDKAGKKHIYHKNKINRLKSRFAKKVASVKSEAKS